VAEPQGGLDIDQELDELETKLERLRSLYEQYFLGIEKIEPAVVRKDVDRRVWVLRREKFRNTAKRFKFQTIIQRYNTYQQYWQRICREIENGTYKRHMLRAEKRLGTEAVTIAAKRRLGAYSRLRQSDPAPVEDAPEAEPPRATRESEPPEARPVAAKPARPLEKLELDIDDMFGSTAAPRLPQSLGAAPPSPSRQPDPSPPPKSPGRPPPPPVRSAPAEPQRRGPPPPPVRAPVRPAAPQAPVGISEQRVQELHRRLVDAQRQVPGARAVSVEGLARTLRDAETKLRAQHGNRAIDFDVVVKDGKAVVKPILR
jgi:hypothetical protein